MKFTVLILLAMAVALGGVTNAFAQGGGVAPWHATTASGGAYDITYDVQGNELYTYGWKVTFNGIGTGAENERIRAFALYHLPDEVMPAEEVVAAGEIVNPIAGRNGKDTVQWSVAGGQQTHGNTIAWRANNPTSNPARSDAIFVGEGIAWFQTTFRNPLPQSYLEPTSHLSSGVHVQWTDEQGRDQSEWISHTPEPVSIVLLALGMPALLIAHRRRNGQV